MASKRYYYSDTISDFRQKGTDTIIGELTLSSPHDINKETSNSWKEEIEILKQSLVDYSGRGSLFFEYNIPRMGRRVDVIILIDDVVFVVEFKTADQQYTRAALIQVWDYALDLKNFHERTADRTVVPILLAPNEKDSNSCFTLHLCADKVYEPLKSNKEQLHECIETVLQNVEHSTNGNSIQRDEVWAKSGYEPTPTIIEAAVSLFEKHTVEDITKHTGEIAATTDCINAIVKQCRELRRKAICFVTGVPGAGKTLIGLQTAIEEFNNGEKAVYLSGNFPLVEVLQEALTRDYIRRAKENYASGKTTERVCTKKEAKSKVKAFIQMIHHYRDLYLEGTRIEGNTIKQIEGYFQSHTDKAYIPTEHVTIYDEAQRAWTKEELARFMKQKKQIDNFPFSEPEYLISCMDRQTDWGLIICLIGGGQEINKGEAGISEWIDSLNRSYPHWHVYMSDKLTEQEYAEGKALEKIEAKNLLHIEPSLHLAVSMRSFRAEKLSLFVHQLLELDKESARQTLQELSNYPIVLTRSLTDAKKWLQSQARGSERYGILASSKAERLKAISINVRYKPDFVHWYLDDENDIRSSNCLEDSLTEFEVQGLEVDWSCVAWDADLRLDAKLKVWRHYQLRSGNSWQNINVQATRNYQINAYRVLLTRARQGMVIMVPKGDYSANPDKTRCPEWYDSIYNYLKEIGIKEIPSTED